MNRTAKSRTDETVGSVRDRRAQRTRSEIIRAGLKVFAAKGFAAATMDDIALELDATKGLLYYHFKTKHDIFRAILNQSPLVPALENDLQTVIDLPLEQALRLTIHGSLRILEANRDFVRFLHVQALLSQEEAGIVYHEVLDRFRERIEQGLERRKTRGELRSDINSGHWARILMSLVTSCFLERQVFGTKRDDDSGYLEHLVGTAVNALAAPTAPGNQGR